MQERPDWRATDLELRSAAPSFTSRTFNRFHDRGYQPIELFFVIGTDAFFEIESWRDYPHILEAAHFVVISRPRVPVREVATRLPHLSARMVTRPHDALSSPIPLIILIDAPTADVSSPRSAIAGGRDRLRGSSCRACSNIEQHGLYTHDPGRRASDAHKHPAGRLHGED